MKKICRHTLFICWFAALVVTMLQYPSAVLAAGGDTRNMVTGVTVTQPVTLEAGAVYKAGAEIRIGFMLARPARVIISIYSARPVGTGVRWYAHEGTRVAQIVAPAAKAGEQEVTFPLAQIKAPDAPLPGVPLSQLSAGGTEAIPGDLPGPYVVEVMAGQSFGFAPIQFRKPGEVLPGSRLLTGFIHGATRDGKGNIIAADFHAWSARRYTPDLKAEMLYPNSVGGGQSSQPAECYDVAVDSHDNVYVINRNGVYKFDSQGRAAPWDSTEDQLKYPYPSDVRNLLGVALDESSKGPKRYVFGPGGGGAGSKDYGPDQVNHPGFAFRWGGFAIDKKDNVYLVRASPQPQVQVFDPSGKFVRAMPLPDKLQYQNARFGIDGTLWLNTGDKIIGLDTGTGEIKKTLSASTRNLHIGPDGTIYAASSSQISRFTPGGDPLPFASPAPAAEENGRYLELNPAAHKLPPGAPGYTTHVFSVVGEPDGGFIVLTNDGDSYYSGPLRAMRFTAGGVFVPDTSDAQALPYETGNVFVGSEPAQVTLQLTNLLDQPQTLTLSATVKDLDGHLISQFQQERKVQPLSVTAAPLSLGLAVQMGYYDITVQARNGNRVALSQELFGGRVGPRGRGMPPYSPFGSVRMEANPELIRRAGGGLSRNHNPVYRDFVEPKPGEWRLLPEDSLNFYRDNYAMPAMVILAYGEPWLGGSFPACRIYSYDNWFDYVATVVEHYKGTPLLWQFWNEPNYFWHVPGPYQFEHYAMMLQMSYAIAKAKDPETRFICDGFAGSASEMGKLADEGAAGFTDGVPIHYPGATTLAFDKMPLNGTVESKQAMLRELAAIRDAKFPGREILNTEEGLWSMENRTLRSGPELLARMYVSQIAAGLDRLTWFECFSGNDPSYLLRGMQDGPWPTYFAYATASHFLENAQYVGALSDGLAQVHVFAIAGKPLIVGWSVEGARDFVIPADSDVSVTDWQGGMTTMRAAGGSITLHLSSSAMFVTGVPLAVFKQAAESHPAEQKAVASLAALQGGGKDEWLTLDSLFHAARLAEIAALMPSRIARGRQSLSPVAARRRLDEAYAGIRAHEADGRYLREARTALGIARRTAYFMTFSEGQNPAYAERMAPYVAALAHQVDLYGAAEKIWYPGLMLRVGLDTSNIRKTTPANEPLDEKFNPQVSRKPGETVVLEITLYNWTKERLVGKLSPVVPEGWTPTQASFDYSVEPNQFARFTAIVTVPPTAATGSYSLGAVTSYHGSPQRELHANRVQVKP